MFRSLTFATSPAAWLPLLACTTTIRLLSTYCSHVCLHYCARLLQHPAYRLGFSPCAHHSPSSSPSVCHPGHLRYHQSLTRVHSHSLPVPPPLPLAGARSQGGSTVGRSRSLACVTAVRLSCVVPLAGESPLADARLRLTPMVTCCSLSARPHIMHHYLPAPLLYAYMSAFLFTCLLTYLPPVLPTLCLQHFIQSCQHNAASIVHRLRQSPQPPVQHICTHLGGAACERQRVPSPRVHICLC